MENNKIAKKVQKLLKLAESSNPNEAKNAYEKAMQLMMIHNIEIADTRKDYGYHYKYLSRETQEAKYIIQILLGCFFVKVLKQRVFSENDNKFLTRYQIVGEPTNLEVASYAFDFLISHVKELYKRKKKEGVKVDKQTFYFGFYHGFVDSYKEAKNYVENSRALVPVTDPDLEDFITDELNVTKTAKNNFKVDKNGSDSFEEGYKAGQEAKISRGITEKNDSPVLALN